MSEIAASGFCLNGHYCTYTPLPRQLQSLTFPVRVRCGICSEPAGLAEGIVIRVKRERLAGRHGETWTYYYTTPVDIEWAHAEGGSHPGPRAGEYTSYGQGLQALRGVLRRKYGRNVTIVETWKAGA